MKNLSETPLTITWTFSVLQNGLNQIGERVGEATLPSFQFIISLAVFMSVLAASVTYWHSGWSFAYRRCSIKCGIYNSTPPTFPFPDLILFCCYRIWVQLALFPNCLGCSSQSEARTEYFKQVSCGLLPKCHVTPKVILCYFDYS